MKFLVIACLTFLNFYTAVTAAQTDDVADNVIDQKCGEILSGKLSIAVHNEIRKSKDKVYESSTLKNFCPKFASLDDGQKQDAAVRFLAVYSYYQTACRPSARSKISEKAIKEFSLLAPSAHKLVAGDDQPTIMMSGLFWQPTDADDRKSHYAGTPCAYEEWNDLNQADCAVYSLYANDRNSDANSFIKNTAGMPAKTVRKMKERMQEALPNCFDTLPNSSDSQGHGTEKQAPAKVVQ